MDLLNVLSLSFILQLWELEFLLAVVPPLILLYQSPLINGSSVDVQRLLILPVLKILFEPSLSFLLLG